MATGGFQLDLRNARGGALHDSVRVQLTGLDNSRRYSNLLHVSDTLTLDGIEAGIFTRYQVTLWPENYRVIQFILRIQPSQLATREPVRFPVDPDRVTGITAAPYDDLPPALQNVLLASNLDVAPLAGLAGPNLWEALDPLRKACLLNIHAKASATRLGDGRSCFDYLGGLLRLRGDRFYAKAAGALREEVQNARALFEKANGVLHHPHDPAYKPAGSWKTRDGFGNLQLSFFRRGDSGDDYVVDADIDEAQGIRHGFEVARNHLLDHDTNPYDIREVLLRYQQLDPGYDFQFAAQARAAHA